VDDGDAAAVVAVVLVPGSAAVVAVVLVPGSAAVVLIQA
jgi:hypothetical protein